MKSAAERAFLDRLADGAPSRSRVQLSRQLSDRILAEGLRRRHGAQSIWLLSGSDVRAE
jgi:hypothetical protein